LIRLGRSRLKTPWLDVNGVTDDHRLPAPQQVVHGDGYTDRLGRDGVRVPGTPGTLLATAERGFGFCWFSHGLRDLLVLKL
jgi:hypothetical protein